ncbi:hypothetical protein [Rhodococcus sp. T9N]|uniref:hypothetical protein n=1 Tax=Rhodococcus sp. T9N TaxID=627445 RepID=UPI0021C2CC55|nr:hypothetical protein [Rhodococcus sp. T9N]
MSHERTVRPGSGDLVFGGVMALPLPTAGFTPVRVLPSRRALRKALGVLRCAGVTDGY